MSEPTPSEPRPADAAMGHAEPDARATERVALHFASALRAYIARRAPAEDVDDVLQEALLRVHRGLPDRRTEGPEELGQRRLASWVYAVTRSALVDHLRRARPHDSLPEELAAEPVEPDDTVASEVAGWLRPMIEALEPRHREALQRVELEGMSQRELASSLGLSSSGARSRVQRARAALRDAVERCCSIELDARNRVADYTPRPGCC